jgi:hypothetical protein
LRRNDGNDNYNVQTNWDGTYWNLKGYNGDNYHAPCKVNYADSAGSAPANGGTATNANYVANDTANMRFHWNGQSGQPTWLWGGSSAADMYVYNPSNFNVNYAATAGNANTVGGKTVDQIISSAATNTNSVIVRGTVADGGTIPLPSGFTKDQCFVLNLAPIPVSVPTGCKYVGSNANYDNNFVVTAKTLYFTPYGSNPEGSGPPASMPCTAKYSLLGVK